MPCAITYSMLSVSPESWSPCQRNPVEPPWYGPVCPVVWEGRCREMPPYPDLDGFEHGGILRCAGVDRLSLDAALQLLCQIPASIYGSWQALTSFDLMIRHSGSL